MADLLLGAVAYDPKVVTIWEGFRNALHHDGFDLDFILYAHYERQAEDLVRGRFDVAWNSPLAWVRSRRLAEAEGVDVRPIVMRDSDRDLVSVVAVRAGSDLRTLSDLKGRRLGVGAVDSPQATLLPLSLLRSVGLHPVDDLDVTYFNIGVGLHGDHIGGERAAASALAAGELDAACMSDTNLLLFSNEGTLSPGEVRVLAETPAYDHCNMTVGPAAEPSATDRFTTLLLAMSYADPRVRSLLDLEGLKQWLPGRSEGYAALESAVDEAAFYGPRGELLGVDRRA